MTLPDPQPGLVIRYSYLWWDQARRGQEEGSKDRPCAVVLAALQADGTTRVMLVPVTHARPTDPRHGVEIPMATKRRLGLDDQRSWIVTNELNRFTWPGPDLRPTSRDAPEKFAFGYLPQALFAMVREQVKANAKEVAGKAVNRDT
jgi:hypothetical protein